MDGIELGNEPCRFEVNFQSKPRAVLAVVSTVSFAGFCLMAGPAYYFDWPQVKQGISASEEIFISLALGLFGLCALWFAALHIWRLHGPDFDVRVYDFGLVLHPAAYKKPIPWTRIRRSRIKKTQGLYAQGYWYNKLELELTEPIWSLMFPIPTTKVTFRSPREWGHNPAIAELGRHIRAQRLNAGWKR